LGNFDSISCRFGSGGIGISHDALNIGDVEDDDDNNEDFEVFINGVDGRTGNLVTLASGIKIPVFWGHTK
jgi:hypothetical protein